MKPKLQITLRNATLIEAN